MRNSLFIVGVFAVALSVAPACATKKFVRTSVGEVNDKVGTMGKSLEETQERVKTAEGRIVEVDAKAGAANDAAAKANAAAADAATAARKAADAGLVDMNNLVEIWRSALIPEGPTFKSLIDEIYEFRDGFLSNACDESVNIKHEEITNLLIQVSGELEKVLSIEKARKGKLQVLSNF